jgi:signal transduction histidine kinase
MEDLIIPDHLKAAHEAGMNRYLSTGERRVIGKGRVQLEARRKDGSLFPVELSISSAESEHGELFVSFARDISRRVAAEQELIKARDEAVAGERAKADLIAVMSHEMRTPLNGMLGTLELLDAEGRDPKDANTSTSSARRGGSFCTMSTTFWKSRARRPERSCPRTMSSRFRPWCGNWPRASAASRSIAATPSPTGSRPSETTMSSGDPTRIRQVLLNLVGNAIKFTRNGSIALEAERLGDSEVVEFRVIDTGIGIDPGDQARVFDDFVTLDTSYSRAVGGTGLGLAIVKRIAGALGGEVGLESAPGEGSLFRVRLPLPAADGAHAQAAPDSGAAGTSRRLP